MKTNPSKNSVSIPVSQPIATSEFTPEAPELPAGLPGLPNLPSIPSLPIPWPPPHFCRLSLPQGCYQLTISTTYSSPPILFRSFKLGSLRVEQSGTGFVISGDTYRYSFFDLLRGGIPSLGPTEIPIYPRSRYGSYLKATGVTIPRLSFGTCRITLDLDEYDYTQPAPGGG
jgi:hypothetical protein